MKNNQLPIIGLVCFAAVATACSASEPKSISEWIVRPSSELSIPRAAHQTTAISPTLVLVTGGCSGSGCTPVERSAELVHIETGRSEVTQPMNEARRSEEHTSELQSLMRISYAVFCLKKKKNRQDTK